MCKLMAFTDASKLKSLERTVNRVLPLITARDRDGFGWSALGTSGAFGERMTDLGHGFRLNLERYAVKLPVIQKTYEAFGTMAPISGGLILHGRTSTNTKSLVNTHPIARDGWTLVHNGVVSNHGPEYKQHTTNDTEHLVYHMATSGVSAVEEHLTGYYAFAAFDSKGRLHVCRDSLATLHMAWVRSIESYVFATTRDLIEDLCKQMKWKCGPIDKVEDNVYMVFSGNELVERRSISPRGMQAREASYVSTSLHYLDSSTKGASTYKWLEQDASKPEVSDDEDKLFRELGVEVDDVEQFLDEVATMDASYEIYDEDDKPVDLYEFRKMDLVSKLLCLVVRPDGTVCSPYDYKRERLA